MVSIGQIADRPAECVHAAPEGTREMFYRNRACLGARVPSEEYESERPLEFQAKCIVLLIEEASRKALMDMLIAAGRTLSDKLRVEFNYTTSKSPNPDLEATSMNCAIGGLILENYRRDAVGQEREEELRLLKQDLKAKTAQVEVLDRTLRGLSVYRSPSAPPPPLLPLTPPGKFAPPSRPVATPLPEWLAQLRRERSALSLAVQAKLAEKGGPCVPSPYKTCGRTLRDAPDPWVAKDGTPCMGYATREALEGYFCAHWGSPARARASNRELCVCMCVCGPTAPHATLTPPAFARLRRTTSPLRPTTRPRSCCPTRPRGATRRLAS